MSVAKKAVDSTLKRILKYTAEIIMSIILLVIICIPLTFTIPMWLQNIALGTPRAELLIDPLAWFGPLGAFWATTLLSLASIVLGYLFLYRIVPSSAAPVDESDEEPEEEYEEIEEEEEEELEEEADPEEETDASDSEDSDEEEE